MLNRIKNGIPSLLILTMLISIPVTNISITAYAASESESVAKKAFTYVEYRNAIQDALKAYKKDSTKEMLIASIDTYLQLPTLEEYPKVEYVNDKKDFAEDILAEINKLKTATDQNEVKTYFASKTVDLIFTSKSFNDWGVANSLIKLLPEGTARTELATKLEEAKKVLPMGPDDYIDWNNPPDNLNDYLDKNPIPKYDNLPPGVSKEDYEKNKPTLPPLSNYDRSEISYHSEGGKTYKISRHYKNGKLVKTDKILADKKDRLFAGIGTTPQTADAGFQGFDPYSTEAMNELREKEEQNNDKGLITIQYTFDKDSDSPNFYDSGITVSDDKTITYTQAKDILHMISIQAKGKFAEDKDKAIALIDGTIIKVDDRGEWIAADAFASLFKEAPVGIRVIDTQSGEYIYYN